MLLMTDALVFLLHGQASSLSYVEQAAGLLIPGNQGTGKEFNLAARQRGEYWYSAKGFFTHLWRLDWMGCAIVTLRSLSAPKALLRASTLRAREFTFES